MEFARSLESITKVLFSLYRSNPLLGTMIQVLYSVIEG